MSSHSWLEFDPRALAGNLQRLRAWLAPETELIFVVKSNAYGHGVAAVAACAWAAGVRWYAVMHVSEALELRALLPAATIVVLGAEVGVDAATWSRHGFIAVVGSEAYGLALADVAAAAGASAVCHVEIDTGIGRSGIPWAAAVAAIERLHACAGLTIDGMATHFAAVTEDAHPFTIEQADRFLAVVAACGDRGLPAGFTHAGNLAAAMHRPDLLGRFAGIRVGLLVYGYGPAALCARLGIEPALQWKSRVAMVRGLPAGSPIGYGSVCVTTRATTVATIQVGYADGYSYLQSNKGCVLIGGVRRPILGRVSMNMITVDAGRPGEVRCGDEVVLLGRQGAESLWADEMAAWRNTIPYDVLTGIRADFPGKALPAVDSAPGA